MSSVGSAIAPYSKEVIALIAPLIGALVARTIQPKAKLAHSIRHAFTYLIQEPVKDADGKVIAPSQLIYSVTATASEFLNTAL
jgi:hypothetical protein